MATAMSEEKAKMLRGELYWAFADDLVAERSACEHNCRVFNSATNISRLERINLWNSITGSPHLPASTADDSRTLGRAAWVEAPFRADYGTNIELGENVFVNYNCTFIDTCRIRVGSRTLIGPNVSLYTGTHPLDPDVRNGTNGPEYGSDIVIGDDCWLGGGVTVLCGVTIGRGSVIGAASVVTKDVPEYSVAVGNPARVIRRLRPVDERVPKKEGEGKEAHDARALLGRLEALEAEMTEIKAKLAVAV